MSRKLFVIPLVLSGLAFAGCTTKESTTEQKVDKAAQEAGDAAKDAAKKVDEAVTPPEKH